jgi:hypothetical protein
VFLQETCLFSVRFRQVSLYSYSIARVFYQDFLDRRLLLTMKIQNKELLVIELELSLRRFNGSLRDSFNRYGMSVSEMTSFCLP